MCFHGSDEVFLQFAGLNYILRELPEPDLGCQVGLEHWCAYVGEVQSMWMPTIRDRAYVLFETEEAAEAARQGTHGLEWPHGNRTSLRPK